jgi:hypothetical protein
MKTATNAVLHPAASMMNSIRVISRAKRGARGGAMAAADDRETRRLGISAPFEVSRKSDDDISKEDRGMLTPGV